MTDIKNKVQSIDPNVRARNIVQFTKNTDNIYHSLVIISKRAKQVAVDVKLELHGKLEEFAIHTDTIEEIQEWQPLKRTPIRRKRKTTHKN